MTPWPTVTLHDISRPKQWKTIAKAHLKDEGFPVYGANGVIGCYDDYNHERPTVLIGCRGSCGSVHVSAPRSWVTGNAMALDDLDTTRVDQHFLVYALRADGLQAAVTGTSQPQITRTSLKQVRIPLPPIQEQRRIAAVLDAADALRAKRHEALTKLEALTQAIFIDMFGGGARPPVNPGPVADTHPEGWPWVELPSVATMATGHTPGRGNAEYWDGDVGWVNLNEIRGLDGQWCHQTELTITPAGIANSSAVILPVGTVCLSRTASIGFVTTLAAPMATSQDFVNWMCTDELRPDYLMWAFLMSRDALRASSSGSTHRTIYVRDAQRFRVLLPPVDLQREFERRLGALRATRESMRGSAPKLEECFTSLEQRAFRGAL